MQKDEPTCRCPVTWAHLFFGVALLPSALEIAAQREPVAEALPASAVAPRAAARAQASPCPGPWYFPANPDLQKSPPSLFSSTRPKFVKKGKQKMHSQSIPKKASSTPKPSQITHRSLYFRSGRKRFIAFLLIPRQTFELSMSENAFSLHACLPCIS